jgi:flagellar protein FlaG
MAGTFSSASHETDTRMRTDFKIVATQATYSISGGLAKIWMKNIGTNPVGIPEIRQSDVFIGLVGNFQRANYMSPITDNEQWNYKFDGFLEDTNNNGYWDTGETLEIDATSAWFTASDQRVYFQFVLPNGVWRSTEFTT